jgi:hypothetical protein
MRRRGPSAGRDPAGRRSGRRPRAARVVSTRRDSPARNGRPPAPALWYEAQEARPGGRRRPWVPDERPGGRVGRTAEVLVPGPWTEDSPLRGPPARGSAGGVPFSLHRARTGRAASLVNRRTNPRGSAAAEHGVQSRYRLERRPKRLEYECVRSLRTQQRAESQCQVITPFCGFLWVD